MLLPKTEMVISNKEAENWGCAAPTTALIELKVRKLDAHKCPQYVQETTPVISLHKYFAVDYCAPDVQRGKSSASQASITLSLGAVWLSVRQHFCRLSSTLPIYVRLKLQLFRKRQDDRPKLTVRLPHKQLMLSLYTHPHSSPIGWPILCLAKILDNYMAC